jgi:uncharacterized membrane protein YjjB (DUF3815 family)
VNIQKELHKAKKDRIWWCLITSFIGTIVGYCMTSHLGVAWSLGMFCGAGGWTYASNRVDRLRALQELTGGRSD